MNEQQLAVRLQPIYKHLHESPEISWKEEKTTAFIKKFLEDEGFHPHTFHDMTGLYVDIGKGIPKVGFRTDMDALWQEVDGMFQANHSCGHDAHMTVALGVVLLLKELGSSLPGAVRIIFQPAEEKAQGAKALLEQGVVDPLEYLFGMHVRPLLELQDDTYAPALHHGATKLFTGKIIGHEAHGARPEQGVNVIEAAAALVDGLKRIWIDPNEASSIKMTQLQAGGSSANIIPCSGTFRIDARAQTNEAMNDLTRELERAARAVTELFDVTIDYETESHIVAAQVDEAAKEIMKQAIVDVAGKEKCAADVTTPGGEDFHFYSYFRPNLKTTMLGLGCGVTPGLHHPKMTLHEKRLPTGAKIITRALVLALYETAKSS